MSTSYATEPDYRVLINWGEICRLFTTPLHTLVVMASIYSPTECSFPLKRKAVSQGHQAVPCILRLYESNNIGTKRHFCNRNLASCMLPLSCCFDDFWYYLHARTPCHMYNDSARCSQSFLLMESLAHSSTWSRAEGS